VSAAPALGAGAEWIVEARGCDPARLRSVDVLRELFDRVVRELALHPVAEAQWHEFDGAGGVTGLLMLSESHLTVHTFPEHASACVNLFCCRPREAWDWSTGLRESLGAEAVDVRVLERRYGADVLGRVPAECGRVPSACGPAAEGRGLPAEDALD